MSDDSFIREVDEELRHDRIKSVWDTYGKYIIGAAVAVVVVTAGYRGWEYYTGLQAGRSGAEFLKAVEASDAGRQDDAIKSLEALAADGSGQYPALAKMRLAGELAARGDQEGAIAAFDTIAGDNSFDVVLRSVARLRAGLLAVDSENHDRVKARLEPLAAAGGMYRSLAREALAISALKAGLNEEAADWFRQIVDDAGAAGNVRSRASIMLNLLAGKGVTADG